MIRSGANPKPRDSGPRLPHDRPAWKTWGLRFAVLLLAPVVLFVALEVLFRLVNATGLVRLGDWENIPGGGFKFAPNVMGGNSRGFRDLERTDAKPAGVYRVLFLGDSFVFGIVDREKNFPALIESALNALGPSRRIEIINLGVSGFGPLDCLNLWRNYGVRFDPDAVVMGFYHGNDFTDNRAGVRRMALLGELVSIRRGNWSHKSHLWLFLAKRWQVMRYRLAHDPSPKAGHWVTREDVIRGAREGLGLFAPDWPARFHQTRFEDLRAVFADLARYSRESDTPLAVVAYPSQIMIDREFAREVTGHSDPKAAFDFRQPIAMLDEVLAPTDIPHMDITDAIEAAHQTEPQYPENDSHWNEAGTATAAAAMTPFIAKFLAQNGLVFSATTP